MSLLILIAGCGGATQATPSELEAPRASEAPEDVTPTSLQSACDDGDLGSCTELGILFQAGNGVSSDPDRACELFMRSCDGDHQLGCANLGWNLITGVGVAEDRTRGVALLEEACRRGEPLACTALGHLLSHNWRAVIASEERVLEEDYERALELYQRSCELDYIPSCTLAAQLLAMGRGAEADLQRATALFRRACDGGDAVACMELETQRRSEERNRAWDERERRPLDERLSSCEGGDVDICMSIGDLSLHLDEPARQRALIVLRRLCESGTSDQVCGVVGLLLSDGTSPDESEVIANLARGCSVADNAGCRSLARMVEDRDSSARNDPTVRAALGRACGRGDPFFCAINVLHSPLQEQLRACEEQAPAVCRHLGIRYGSDLFDVVPRDDARARVLLRRACDADDASACETLGVLYASGAGGEVDLEAAREAYEHGCRWSHTNCCGRLGEMLLHGEGGDVDRPRALGLLRESCRLACEASCELLESMEEEE